MNAVDTNVFVYAIDSHEPVKQAKAIDLLTQLRALRLHSPTVLLWQAASEFLSCLRKWQAQGRISETEVEGHLLDTLRMFPLSVPSKAVFSVSLDLSSRYSLSHWDSMLLAACIEAGVDTLYSEDLTAGMMYGSVTVVNPFV